MQFVIGAFIVFAAASVAIHFWLISLLILAIYPSIRLTRLIMMKRYFANPNFLALKAEVQSVVQEHNEIASYVEEISENGKFDIGHSNTGANAHLASFKNTSQYRYKRDRNIAEYDSLNVHNGSLQIVRNAASDPIKYLIKYFDISASEEKLSDIESLGETISKLENAIENITKREESISGVINPPKFIVKYYLDDFRAQIGLSVPKIEIPYPQYKFQYVSAGGNSSQQTEIELNTPTIDALIETLSEKIKFTKSAAGQRSLMTASFREFIKQRDKYTCKYCKISTKDEEHLLLEVDHIKPVSKGGLSVETNLQTLCWKCNRTKSNKDQS